MPIGTSSSSTRWRGKELRRGVDQYLHKVHQMGTRLLKDEHVAELKLQQRRPPADGQVLAVHAIYRALLYHSVKLKNTQKKFQEKKTVSNQSITEKNKLIFHFP